MRGSNLKPPPCRGLLDRPAGERARHLGDVLLRVAAVDAERVQLHQLARVVLVQPARRAWRCRRAGIAGMAGVERRRRRAHRGRACGRSVGAHPVVEIEEHRRALRRRLEQIAEPAEDVRADGVALVLGEQEARRGPSARRR